MAILLMTAAIENSPFKYLTTSNPNLLQELNANEISTEALLIMCHKKLDALLETYHHNIAKMHSSTDKIIKVDNRNLSEKEAIYKGHLLRFYNADNAFSCSTIIAQDYKRYKSIDQNAINIKLLDLIDKTPTPANLDNFKKAVASKPNQIINDRLGYNILHALLSKFSELNLSDAKKSYANWHSAVKYKIYIKAIREALSVDQLRQLMHQKSSTGNTPFELFYNNCQHGLKAHYYNLNENGVFLFETALNYNHQLYIKNDNSWLRNIWQITAVAVTAIFTKIVSGKTDNNKTVKAVTDAVEAANIAHDAKQNFDAKKDELNKSHTTGYSEKHQIKLKNILMIGVLGRTKFSWLLGPCTKLDLKAGLKQNTQAFSSIDDAIYTLNDLKSRFNEMPSKQKFVALHVLTQREQVLNKQLNDLTVKESGAWQYCKNQIKSVFYARTIKHLKLAISDVHSSCVFLKKHFTADAKPQQLDTYAKLENYARIQLATFAWTEQVDQYKFADKSNTNLNFFTKNFEKATGFNVKGSLINILSAAYAGCIGMLQYAAKAGASEVIKRQ